MFLLRTHMYVQGRGVSSIEGDHVDGGLRSSNSRNETLKQFRHRKVRSMFQGNSVAGNGLSPGGTAANSPEHEGRPLPIEASREGSLVPLSSPPSQSSSPLGLPLRSLSKPAAWIPRATDDR